jgi:hypothetical protein
MRVAFGLIHDAGADFAQGAGLLVDVHVEASPQQAQRRGQAADAAADDGDRCVLVGHVVVSSNRTPERRIAGLAGRGRLRAFETNQPSALAGARYRDGIPM